MSTCVTAIRMGDTGLETVARGQVGRESAYLLSFDVLKLAGIRSEWNLEWNLGARLPGQAAAHPRSVVPLAGNTLRRTTSPRSVAPRRER